MHLTIYSSQVFSKQTQNVHKKQVDEDLRITNPVEQHSGGGKCIIKNKKRMERRPIIGETWINKHISGSVMGLVAKVALMRHSGALIQYKRECIRLGRPDYAVHLTFRTNRHQLTPRNQLSRGKLRMMPRPKCSVPLNIHRITWDVAICFFLIIQHLLLCKLPLIRRSPHRNQAGVSTPGLWYVSIIYKI